MQNCAVFLVLIHSGQLQSEFNVMLACSLEDMTCCEGIIQRGPALGNPVQTLLPFYQPNQNCLVSTNQLHACHLTRLIRGFLFGSSTEGAIDEVNTPNTHKR